MRLRTGKLRVAAAAVAAGCLAVVAACGSEDGAPGSASAPAGAAASPAGSPAASATPPGPTQPPRFSSSVDKVARDQVRHSWRPECPVPRSKLRLITMTHWGFDDAAHTGRLIVHKRVADDVVKVFRELYEERYPIHKMRLIDAYEGSDFDSIEDNNTSAFNCRSATGSGSWSQHALGLAIDLNPCENPYVRPGGRVSHDDCEKYADRDLDEPGMVHEGDTVVDAFESIGWGWGGRWSGVKDYQHFSESGR